MGTALATTLLLGSVMAPTPAHAVRTCFPGDPGVNPVPGGIAINTNAEAIDCENVFDRNNAGAPVIDLLTYGGSHGIILDNSGDLTSPDDRGIRAYSHDASSAVSVTNTGDIDSERSAIYARTDGTNSTLYVSNSGHLDVGYSGIWATTGVGGAGASAITVINTGDVELENPGTAINAESYGTGSTISVTNSGALTGGFRGIALRSTGDAAALDIANSGVVASINDPSNFNFSSYGITAFTSGQDSGISLANTGVVAAVAVSGFAYGIRAESSGQDSSVRITNSGPVLAIGAGGSQAYGIVANSSDAGSSIAITNTGDLVVFADQSAKGISATSNNAGPVSIQNSGALESEGDLYATGIEVAVTGAGSPVTIQNSGKITATAGSGYGSGAAGILVNAYANRVSIVNSGAIYAEGDSGSQLAAVFVSSTSDTTIRNSGEIGASSDLAIWVDGGSADISNSGTITGFVRLSADDQFINLPGGVFAARGTSDFDYSALGGNDLFANRRGATVQVNGDVSFVNLERFENEGLISLVNGRAGDSFIISNTPGGEDLNFVAAGNSTLAVEAVLRGADNSLSDSFTIEGSVRGVTKIQVNNLEPGLGVFNPSGVRLVTATGATPNPNAFQLEQPVDAGFFNYDLVFTPTGSGFWSLKSYPGAGAYMLPQLMTAAQDIWHQSAATWSDRTADLRVMLNGGGASSASGPMVPAYVGGAEPHYELASSLTPAVWVKGSGGWLDRDDSVQTTAYGRNVSFNLDRDLETIDFQTGLDMGKQDVWRPGDALVFGILGGFVSANLDYDSLARRFNFSGGQIGAYATYLNGRLFVDTLANLHLYELEAGGNSGFPDSLDANTFGLRSDAGYRLGAFSGGAFIEPLATLEVTWADIDGFSVGGNSVSFDDDPNVRGRLGLRTGTTMAAWEGTLIEPFVTASLWGNLSGDNQASLVSSGTRFTFQDDLQDVWGEVSAGVNVFNFSETTTVFAKADVTFGDDISGVGGKAGMRVAW